MSYAGYQCRIGNIKFPIPDGMENSIVKDGSYSLAREPRKIGSWTDDQGIEHVDYFPAKKAIIKFTIRQRTEEEHDFIKGIFEQTNVRVKYYNDNSGAYEESDFEMKAAEVRTAYADKTEIYYQETQITLEEY